MSKTKQEFELFWHFEIVHKLEIIPAERGTGGKQSKLRGSDLLLPRQAPGQAGEEALGMEALGYNHGSPGGRPDPDPQTQHKRSIAQLHDVAKPSPA
ncbi:hypothetical protein SRHO_G00106600 [Serrasalmus rhombeus]